MIQTLSRITSVKNLKDNIWSLGFTEPKIASIVKPGQFINVKINEYNTPLLRRPFSVQSICGNEITILFHIFGLGTALLTEKKPGDKLDILGPLGNSFNTDGSFETAILLGGGIGVAPFAFLTNVLKQSSKKIITFIGARSADQIYSDNLENLYIATDDGSIGFHGNVVELFKSQLQIQKFHKPKIFACGPTPMLKSVANLINEIGIECEASLESAMACGFGICQGCPVELVDENKKYALVCKDGPVFDISTIKIFGNG